MNLALKDYVVFGQTRVTQEKDTGKKDTVVNSASEDVEWHSMRRTSNVQGTQSKRVINRGDVGLVKENLWQGVSIS